MAATISGLRRNLKNVAHNYTDAQVKVREATSNDPWGPSSTQMAEIADLTYNVIAFSEIMQMIWKRVNDSGKNWRHVYKALVLLEYLIKTGSEKVAQQCRENIFSIQTLKDFQFFEENKDQGLNVREKAKALVALLKDDEKLKNERVRALKAKERFAQSTAGIGSDTAFGGAGGGGGGMMSSHTGRMSPAMGYQDERLKTDLELARPQTQGEEELQLQLALAMSREEAEAEESKKKSDEMRLKLALQKSKEETEKQDEVGGAQSAGNGPNGHSGGATGLSALNDLVDINFGNPLNPGNNGGAAAGLDPWGGGASSQPDPWGLTAPQGATAAPNQDPWGAPSADSPLGAGGFSTSPLGGFQPGQNRTISPIGAGGFQTTHNSTSATTQPSGDPWSPQGAGASNGMPLADPWGAPAPAPAPGPVSPARYPPAVSPNNTQDPFSPTGGSASGSAGLLAAFDTGASTSVPDASNPWDLSTLDPMRQGVSPPPLQAGGGAKPKKTVESLLGEHSNLVNLDNLVQIKGTASAAAKNPFADQPNPFQAAAAPKPTINQLRTGQTMSGGKGSPWPESNPTNNQNDINPFF